MLITWTMTCWKLKASPIDVTRLSSPSFSLGTRLHFMALPSPCCTLVRKPNQRLVPCVPVLLWCPVVKSISGGGKSCGTTPSGQVGEVDIDPGCKCFYRRQLTDNPLPHCLFTVHVFSLITWEKFHNWRLLDLKKGLASDHIHTLKYRSTNHSMLSRRSYRISFN